MTKCVAFVLMGIFFFFFFFYFLERECVCVRDVVAFCKEKEKRNFLQKCDGMKHQAWAEISFEKYHVLKQSSIP